MGWALVQAGRWTTGSPLGPRLGQPCSPRQLPEVLAGPVAPGWTGLTTARPEAKKGSLQAGHLAGGPGSGFGI